MNELKFVEEIPLHNLVKYPQKKLVVSGSANIQTILRIAYRMTKLQVFQDLENEFVDTQMNYYGWTTDKFNEAYKSWIPEHKQLTKEEGV